MVLLIQSRRGGRKVMASRTAPMRQAHADLPRKVLQLCRCLALGIRKKYSPSGEKESKIAYAGQTIRI